MGLQTGWKLMMAGTVAFLLAGCAVTSSLEVLPGEEGEKTAEGEPVAYHLRVSNTGLFLFGFIPLGSGHAGRPGRGDWALWRNQVREKYALMMLDDACRRLHCREVRNFNYRSRSDGWIGLWIVWRKSFGASAVAISETGKGKSKDKSDK